MGFLKSLNGDLINYIGTFFQLLVRSSKLRPTDSIQNRMGLLLPSRTINYAYYVNFLFVIACSNTDLFQEFISP